MKRAFTITVFLIVFLLIFFLQSNFFNWYNIAGIKPNLFIIFTLCIGLWLGKYYGIIFGAVFGVLLDLFIGSRIGFNGIMLTITGLIGGLLSKEFAKRNRISFIIMIAFITILSEIIKYTLQIIILHAQDNFLYFMQILIIEAIFNAILSIILYSIIQKTGKFSSRNL